LDPSSFQGFSAFLIFVVGEECLDRFIYEAFEDGAGGPEAEGGFDAALAIDVADVVNGRLLWPHPSYCAVPTGFIFIAGGPHPTQQVPTFICQSLMTCHRPYSDGSAGRPRIRAPRLGLRLFTRGSATIPPPTGLRVVPLRSCNVRLMLRPAISLAPLRMGRLRPSLPVSDRSKHRSVMTTRAFVSPLTGLSPAALAALWAAR